GADRPPSDAARLWSRSAAADYGQVGPGGVTATRRDEDRLVRVIELVLDVPGKLDVPGSSTLLGGCSGGCLGGASTGSSVSSSWCSTFPGSSTFPGVQRCWEGVPGVAWEGRALARPLHRAGARRSREFYVFGKLGVLGSGGSGVAWEGRALARPFHRAGARRSRETRPGSSTLPGGSVSV